MEEQVPLKHQVAGSTPASPATLIDIAARALAENAVPNWGGKHYDEKPDADVNHGHRHHACIVLRAVRIIT